MYFLKINCQTNYYFILLPIFHVISPILCCNCSDNTYQIEISNSSMTPPRFRLANGGNIASVKLS